MRLEVSFGACLLLLLAACTSTPESVPPIPPPDQMSSTTVSTGARPTTTTPPASGPIRGALPDGTEFVVYLQPAVDEQVTGVGFAIIVELDDPSAPALQSSTAVLGITTFANQPVESAAWDFGNTYRLPAGRFSVFIDVYEHLIPYLGPDYRSMVETGILGTTVNGAPVLDLSPPFRFATDDDEIPLQMEVMFETFVVRRGCGDLAVACSRSHSLQVIPLEAVSSAAPAWGNQQVSIESPVVLAECPPIGPERSDSGVGPVFVCELGTEGGSMYGGHLVSREGVTTAEEAVLAWLAGPSEGEQEAGLEGWDLRPYPWFADSMTFHREGKTLVMEVGQWEAIDNLSTSNGSAVFYTSLFGTVFSDPNVEQFELSILGKSCPVFIGESEWCFPIDWDDFVASLG
jgi:hypothetical protein